MGVLKTPLTTTPESIDFIRVKIVDLGVPETFVFGTPTMIDSLGMFKKLSNVNFAW